MSPDMLHRYQPSQASRVRAAPARAHRVRKRWYWDPCPIGGLRAHREPGPLVTVQGSGPVRHRERSGEGRGEGGHGDAKTQVRRAVEEEPSRWWVFQGIGSGLGQVGGAEKGWGSVEPASQDTPQYRASPSPRPTPLKAP